MKLPDYRGVVKRVRKHDVLYGSTSARLHHHFMSFRLSRPALKKSSHGSYNRPELPDGPARNTFVKVCSGCHPAEVVLGRMDKPKNWARKVASMINRSAVATDAEGNQVNAYLNPSFASCGRPISNFLTVAFFG